VNLPAAATLDLWEAGHGLSSTGRSLALAAAAGPEGCDVDDLARLPLGRRDALLLGLHSALAGPTLDATASCPACGEAAEFGVDVGELVAQSGELVAAPPTPLEVDGFVVLWRLPDSSDVDAASAAGSAQEAERVLLERCVADARDPDGEAIDALPAGVRAALARAMADADPLAEVLVNVTCPECSEEFVADVDVGRFVWAELQARGQRVLREVDVLARAYGWTEAEVLALAERRRAAYLALAEKGSP
jgi:hypothetical protein